jgi:hypothetical protein
MCVRLCVCVPTCTTACCASNDAPNQEPRPAHVEHGYSHEKPTRAAEPGALSHHSHHQAAVAPAPAATQRGRPDREEDLSLVRAIGSLDGSVLLHALEARLCQTLQGRRRASSVEKMVFSHGSWMRAQPGVNHNHTITRTRTRTRTHTHTSAAREHISTSIKRAHLTTQTSCVAQQRGTDAELRRLQRARQPRELASCAPR